MCTHGANIKTLRKNFKVYIFLLVPPGAFNMTDILLQQMRLSNVILKINTNEMSTLKTGLCRE
jgi:hypothetical protein